MVRIPENTREFGVIPLTKRESERLMCEVEFFWEVLFRERTKAVFSGVAFFSC